MFRLSHGRIARELARKLCSQRALTHNGCGGGMYAFSRTSATQLVMPAVRGFSSVLATERPGKFGLEGLHQPTDFARLGSLIEQECNELLEIAVTPSTDPREVLQSIDKISNNLCCVVDVAVLCGAVHETEEWSTAANELNMHLRGLMDTLNTSKPLLQALQRLINDKEFFATLSTEEQRVCESHLHDLEVRGLNLNEAEREATVALEQRIEHINGVFAQNIQITQSMPLQLHNLKPNLAQRFKQTEPGVSIVDRQSVINLIYLEPDSDQRAIAYKACYTGPYFEQNDGVLAELLKARAELAQLRKSPSHAHFELQSMLGNSPEQVGEFLHDLAAELRPRAWEEASWIRRAKYLDLQAAQEEPSLLPGFLQKATPEPDAAAVAEVEVHPWDLRYYMNKLKDEAVPDIRAYLSLDTCLDGLGLIMSEVFNCSLKPVAWDPTYSWATPHTGNSVDQGLRHFELWDESTNELLGRVHLDCFARPQKFGAAGTFNIKSGCRIDGQYQIPHCAVLLPFPASASEGLTYAQTETLFHEFGHVLHQLMSRTELQHYSGARAELDFVEVPSIFMENFMRDYRVLSKFAKHRVTGQVIPESYIRAINQHENKFFALDQMSSVVMAQTDQFCHTRTPEQVQGFATKTYGHLYREYMPVTFEEGLHVPATLVHLSSYGGGYYTYLYGEAISNAIWAKYFKEDPLNREMGDLYRREILAPGGGKAPLDMLRSMLGEEFKVTPSLASTKF